VKTIAIHKGISFGRFPPEYARCDDVGRIARAYPDVNFLIYHAGYEPYQAKGPFDPAHTGSGISSLVKSMLVNDIAPNSNVYAELGSTWRLLMRNPTGAAHALGKLLTYVGEDNVLWGTDSIWAGSSQDQIQAFRAFEIAPALQQQYACRPLTPARKAKILGLNGARVYGVEPKLFRNKAEHDGIERLRADYRNAPRPDFETLKPRSRAEFGPFVKHNGNRPGYDIPRLGAPD
jgi:predicted TIM-barrel fold metal-dependent hydrolase